MGSGRYVVDLTAGAGQGLDVFKVTIDDGNGEVTLYPFPTLDHTATLSTDVASLSSAAGGTVQFDLWGPELNPAGRPYLMFASMSGTSPGFRLGTAQVPLNFDALVIVSYLQRNNVNFASFDGMLAADGTATAQFFAAAGALIDVVGVDLSFAYVTADQFDFASSPAVVSIAP